MDYFFQNKSAVMISMKLNQNFMIFPLKIYPSSSFQTWQHFLMMLCFQLCYLDHKDGPGTETMPFN